MYPLGLVGLPASTVHYIMHPVTKRQITRGLPEHKCILPFSKSLMLMDGRVQDVPAFAFAVHLFFWMHTSATINCGGKLKLQNLYALKHSLGYELFFFKKKNVAQIRRLCGKELLTPLIILQHRE